MKSPLLLDVGGMTPAEGARHAESVRRAGGPSFVLACDANQGWRWPLSHDGWAGMGHVSRRGLHRVRAAEVNARCHGLVSNERS